MIRAQFESKVISVKKNIVSKLIQIVFGKRATKKREKKMAKKMLHQLPKIDRGQAQFKLVYPQFQYGRASYGVPTVRDYYDGTTLSIGSYTSIADGVLIILGGHHRTDWITTYPFPAMAPEAAHILEFAGTHGDVTIGNDVWLCSNCTILSGITIGDGAVVAAEAVVTRDVEPYSIVGGNPARVIGWRFPEDVRIQLLASQWWDWPHEEIIKITGTLCSEDTEAFLAYAKARKLGPVER